ncbi:MAG: hypothetical protein RID07_19365, partial [Lacipirellulaceae bacterium]
MFRGSVLRNCDWKFGFVCALLLSASNSVAQENDLFDESAVEIERAANRDEMKRVYDAARAESTNPPATSSRGMVTQSPAMRKANERIDAALDQPLKTPLDFIEIPLNQILMRISDDYNIPIVFDLQALEALAISVETDVTTTLREVSLRTAFEIMLRQVEDLTYMVDNEVLLITSEDEAMQRLEVRVYRVDDLIWVPSTGELDFDSLIDILVSSVEHDSWMENGTGDGEVQPYSPGMLVITQTRRIHQQIETLFSTMREVKAAIEADRPVAAEEPSNAVRTKAFRIQNVWGDDPEQGREVLHEAIAISVGWEQENIDEDDTFLAVLPDRVIARHIPAVLRQVEGTLKQLDYIK